MDVALAVAVVVAVAVAVAVSVVVAVTVAIAVCAAVFIFIAVISVRPKQNCLFTISRPTPESYPNPRLLKTYFPQENNLLKIL